MVIPYREGLFMETVTLQNQNLSPKFISAWIINSLSICDDLIQYFEENPQKQNAGATSSGLRLDSKNSVGITIQPKDLELQSHDTFDRYFKSLFSCYEDYVVQWPFLKTVADKRQIGSFNLQRYHKGQHFQAIHTLHRIFAWMTYLNDVDVKDGGATLSSHYDLEIQPRKGLTLIWPAEWTHAHKGSLLKANSKYIVTGWMHFPNESTSASAE
jgi:hypothetical protein